MDLVPALIIGVVIALIAYSLSFVFVNNFVLLFVQLVVVITAYIFAVKRFQPALYNLALGFIVDKISFLKK
jgi:hypothetical protein